MSNDNNENIITDLSDGENIRREVDYNNKKPILVCFNGRAYRSKDIIKNLLNLMRIKKGQDFYEKILKIRTPTRILFSKSPDEIFNHELIESIYIEKAKYESTSTNYIIELCLAILEQFGYSKEELKILFADERRSYNVDIKSLGPIVWGESGNEYIWNLDDFNGIHYSYLKIPNIYHLYNKIPKVSVNNQEMVAIDYKDGEIIDIHAQASHKGELRIPKKLYKKHDISVDSIIENGRQFKVRCGFLYLNITNYLIILDFQDVEEETKKKAEEYKKKKAEEETKKKAVYNLIWKNLKQKDVEYKDQVEYNEIWKVLRQGSIEEIKKRKIEQEVEEIELDIQEKNRIKELEEENKGLKEEIIKNNDIYSNKIKELEEENKGLKEEIIKNNDIYSNKIIGTGINTSPSGEMIKKDQQIEILNDEMVKKDQQIEKLNKKIENFEISKADVEKISSERRENERILMLIDKDLQVLMKFATEIYKGGITDKTLQGKMVMIPAVLGDETSKLIANKINLALISTGLVTFIKDVKIEGRKK